MFNQLRMPSEWSTMKKLIWLRGNPATGQQGTDLTVSGAPPLSLPNSLGKPLKAWEVDVLPKQDLHGYENPWPAGGGKNKFQTTAESKEENGVTWTVNADGTITVSGSATDYTSLPAGVAYVNSGMGNITISGISEATNVIWSVLTLYDSNNTSLATLYSGGSNPSLTFDMSSYATADHIVIGVKRNNNTTVSGTIKIQVEQGTTATAWTPYSNLCPIYGTDKLTITTAGKNRANLTVAVAPVGYADLTPNSVVIYNETAGTYKSNRFSICKAQDFAGQTVTLGIDCENITGDGRRAVARYYDTYNQAYGSALFEVTGARVERTFTIPADIPSNINLCLLLYCTGGTSETGRVSYTNIQLEFGSTATSYTPYIAPSQTVITLPSTVYTGTVGSEGGESRSNVVTIDDTYEFIVHASNSTNIVFRCASVVPQGSAVESNEISNIFRMHPLAHVLGDSTMQNRFILGESGNLFIQLAIADYPNIEALTTLLHSTPLQIVYQLRVPTEFAVPSVSIPTPKGTATAWATAEDGTVESMEVTYVGKA